MRLLLGFLLFLLCLTASSATLQAQTENTTIAILFEDPQSELLAPKLIKALSQAGFTTQEQSLTKTINQNLKFPNRMNLSTREASNLGQALGVDVFLILRSKIVERADVGASLYGEGYLAIAFVNSRSGKLILFDFIETQQSNTTLASETIAKQLIEQLPSYTQQVLSIVNKQFTPLSLDPQDAEAMEIPAEGSALAEAFDLPEFTARKQPIYTENARKMAVSAIVALEVVLRKDGKVGNIEVVHWAGFGLDESAIMAAKELRFEPALLEDKAVSCRALIRYNFNFRNQK
ncbi:MAG: TonB family C-terminal domain-containing protein [bacterium]|nr:MAG: TonB family C-terminal domain-containing protein [bacterium]